MFVGANCGSRDFTTAAAACGLASAFYAPIGAVLFAAEELATHWDLFLGLQVFVSTLCAVFVVQFLLSSFEAFEYV